MSTPNIAAFDVGARESELDKKLQSLQNERLEEAAKTTATNRGLKYVNLQAFPIDTSAVLLLPEDDARRGRLAIISKKASLLTIALLDPQITETQATLKKLTDKNYTFNLVVVSELSLQKAWERYKISGKKDIVASGVVNLDKNLIDSYQAGIATLNDLKEKIVNLPITQIVDMLIAGALKIGASDIHWEAEEKAVRLRYRLDGVLTDVIDFSHSAYPNILNRLKLVSGMKLNIHDRPQDGRFTIRQKDIDIEVRVSILPGAYGEGVVMRILDPRTIRQHLEDLGMRDDTLEIVKKLLQKSTGAILTTGPTGSGKTTTLYAFVTHVNDASLKIITVEDPIEYHIKGITQTQVDSNAGYTFASGLRAIVRQDPDVILIGEMRDKETSEIAMQAALTGHLVFSTIHTNSAAGTIPRLIDLGVKPQSIAPAINAMMAQRLVRRLCSNCKISTMPSSDDLAILKRYLTPLIEKFKLPNLDENLKLYYPKGCDQCNNLGYKGRIGIYEIILMNDELGRLVLESPAISQIQDVALKNGLVTLLQDALMRVVSGITALPEVMSVIGE